MFLAEYLYPLENNFFDRMNKHFRIGSLMRICIGIFCFFYASPPAKAQLFLNHTLDEIKACYLLDSSLLEESGQTLLFQMDRFNSGTVSFKLKENRCYEYTYLLHCKACFEVYLYRLTEDFYSEWKPYNDSIYYAKERTWGKEWTLGGHSVYFVPKMSTKTSALGSFCWEANVTMDTLSKEAYMQLYSNTPTVKIKKRKLIGEWRLQPNALYPTEINTMSIWNKKTAFISFGYGAEEEPFDLEWLTKNVFQLWDMDEATQELYLTCEITSVTDAVLNVRFYTDEGKFIQTFKKIE